MSKHFHLGKNKDTPLSSLPPEMKISLRILFFLSLVAIFALEIHTVPLYSGL